MRIDVSPIVSADSSAAFHFDGIPQGLADLVSPDVHIRQVVTDAEARHYLGRIYFTLDISCTYDTVCARCLEGLTRTVTTECQRCFAAAGSEISDDDDIDTYTGDVIDLSEAVADSVFTAIPVRDLCAEDCRGICPHCGINLNHGSCDCRETGVDPRWAGLASLLKQD